MEIKNCLIICDRYLHGDLDREAFNFGLSNSFVIISSVGGSRWRKIADDTLSKRIGSGIKEIDYRSDIEDEQ